jgi:hypothetical protein
MNDEHMRLLKEAVHNLHLDNSYGTIQVAFGCKSSGGVFTEEKCIRFGVEKKVPLDQIPEEKRIPKTITIDGVEYKTDVYVAPKDISISTVMRKIDSTEVTEGINVMAVSLCNAIGTNDVPPQSVSTVVSHSRATRRPLRGGVSMAHPPKTGYVNAGTLGLMVVDDRDGKLVGLTNNHVCSVPGESVTSTCRFFTNDTSYPASSSKYETIRMYQQSSWDSGVVNKASDLIGITKRVYPLRSTGSNYVDCGLVNLSDSIINTGSWDVVSSSFGTAPTFASTAEIDAMTTSTQIFKCGRTTGAIGPDNFGGCIIQVTSTSTSLNVGGYIESKNDAISFADCLTLESPSTVVGLGGDSGSGVYAKIGGVWKLVGLFFAGSGDGSYGVACRIDRVAGSLKISPYTGSAITANTGSKSSITLDYATYGGEVSASIGGKMYWQVGKV